MPVEYENVELLHSDDFHELSNWHHEGIGHLESLPGGGMRLACLGSRQGGEGCMAFFRHDLPDHLAYEYDLIVRTQGGLVINYLAIRGINGEDMIADIDDLEPRTGIMANYFSAKWGLQSYHVSISRFNDAGEHTETSNWRRNPGCRLIGHGIDPCMEIGRKYHIRIVKDRGHCQLFADGRFAHGFMDHDHSSPIPDTGKFGFRLIGSEVVAEVCNFHVHRVEPDESIWRCQE
ncbi:MAG: DUF1961 family protein [Planctomycetota bacterium]|nr:DUF1961 family protein [Planctomycetota bacterium]